MSANHNVSITITASNLSSDELRQVVADLKGLGTAADQANVHVAQSGAAARTASGGFKEMSAGATTAAGSLQRIVETAAGVAIGNMIQDAPRLMVEFGKASFQAASAFKENMNKVEVVFGGAADSIREFADDAATSLGLSESAALGAAGTFGNLFTSMGMSQGAAADMSTSIVQLAADLGSFNNIGTDQALEKLRAGLVGEIEPLRSLGVNINAVMVQQKAMNMGLADTAKELTAADKAQASYALILEQTTNAQGDFARTSDGAANSLKTAQASVDDLMVAIGTGLTPAVADYATTMAENVRTMTDWIEKVRDADSAVGELTNRLGAEGDAGPLSRWFEVIKAGGPQLFLMREGFARWKDELGDAAGITDDATFSLAAFIDAGLKIDQMSFADMVMEAARLKDELEGVSGMAVVLAGNLDELKNKSESGIGTMEKSFERFGDAYARQAELAGRANEANTEFFHSVELGSGAAAEMAFALDKVAEAQAGLADAYQAGLGAMATFNSQSSEYAGIQSTLEKGYDILLKRQEAGVDLTTQEQLLLDRYPTLYGRLEGAQEDATVQAALFAGANAEVILAQDALNAAIARGDSNLTPYVENLDNARALAGDSAFADPMTSSLNTLSSTITTVLVPALQDIARMLAELNGQTADVYVRTNFVSVGSPGVGGIGFAEFAEGGLVTAPTFALIGEAGPEVVVPLNKLPASAKADILGNQKGSSNVTMGEAGWLPFVEGLVGDLEAASQAFSGEGLEHAGLFVDTAQAGVGLMLDGLGLLLALAESPAVYTPEIEAGLKQLVELSWKVAYHTGLAAEGLGAEWMEHGQAFSNAAQAGIGTLADGLGLLAAFGDTEALWSPEIEARLKGLVELSWKAAYHMGLAAEGFETEFLEGAAAFNAAASDAFGTLGDALSFLSDLGGVADASLTFTRDFALLFQQLADLAYMAADEIDRTSSAWSEEVNPRLEAFRQDAGASLDLLGDVVGFAETLHGIQDGTLNFGHDFALLFQQMGDVARLAADEIARTSEGWNEEVNPAITAFVEGAGTSLSIMSDMGDTFASILTFGDSVMPEDLTAMAAEMADTVSVIVEAIEQINDDWQTRGAPDILAFAEGAGAAVGLMGDAADAFEAIADSSKLSRRQTEIFTSNFGIALDLVGELADMAEPYKDDAERFLEVVQEIAAAISAAASLISTVAGEAAADASDAAGSLGSAASSLGAGMSAWNKMGMNTSGWQIGGGGGGGGGSSSSGGGAGSQPSFDEKLARRLGFFTTVTSTEGAGTFGLSASLLAQSINYLASKMDVLDNPATEPNEAVQGIDLTFAEEFLSLAQLVDQHSKLFSVQTREAIYAGLANELGDLGLTSTEAIGAALLEQMGFTPELLASMGLDQTAVDELTNALGSAQDPAIEAMNNIAPSVSQAITDSASIQGQIIGEHVAAAVREALRDGLSGLSGGMGAFVNSHLAAQSYQLQGGL